MKEKLTEKQSYALKVMSNTNPQTASELGVAAATLTSLVKKGYIKRIGESSPYKYIKIEKNETPGVTILKTIDNKEFEYNSYSEESSLPYYVRWNDNKGNPHTGSLLRMRKDDEGFYVRSREFNGIVFISLKDICILVEETEKGNFVRELFRR